MTKASDNRQPSGDASIRTCVAVANCSTTEKIASVSESKPDLAQPHVRPTTSRLTVANRWDHFLARLGIKRGARRVEPGLYALGNPSPESPVFVSANYTLSFDALRSALPGIDGYVLVLDTEGINVWCAAGKGTFGTEELVRRTESTRLREVVRHRVILLPQLGASGVAAHEVEERSGFEVEYGPVRASDLPEYLKTHRATPQMRRVRFALRDRLILIPVELVYVFLPVLLIAGAVAIISMWLPPVDVDYAFLFGLGAAVLAGVALFPILLPWIPTRDFSSKGFILGGLVALPFAMTAFLSNVGAPGWLQVGGALPHLLALPPVTAYLALNFTGSTTFTSRSGVRREIFRYVPIMAWMFGIGIVLGIVLFLITLVGGF
ncbi:MAG: carbon monoxide dehydrogenase [Anaerolineae bacterium]|nr:carbon monoxide dehydrogenase [Anaerolineae bacterium]NIQ77773.1 carbon monoxide dehydrogenase [Anaerolineae bacterium]